MLTVGTNSYVTLLEAEAYFASRIDTAAWSSASELIKEQALTTAANMLNEVVWIGVATSDTQVLAFPRTGSYVEPVLGKEVDLNPLVIPPRIKNANCEQAYQLLNNDGLLDQTGTVSKLKVDVIELEGLDKYTSAPPRFSTTAQNFYYPLTMEGCSDLARKYKTGSSGRSWWVAN